MRLIMVTFNPNAPQCAATNVVQHIPPAASQRLCLDFSKIHESADETNLLKKGHLEGRLKIYRNLVASHSINLPPLYEEARKFLEDPKSDYSTLIIPNSLPRTPVKVAKDVDTVAQRAISKETNNLCVRLQKEIDFDHYLTDNPCSWSLFSTFDLEPKNKYEFMGICEGLLPVLMKMVKKTEADINALPTAITGGTYSYANFCAFMSAHAEVNKTNILSFGLDVSGKKNICELDVLEQTLPRWSSLKTICFENFGGRGLCWSDDKAFDYLKKILIDIPNLDTIEFNQVNVCITERNAKVLADIIMQRQNKEGRTKITDVRFTSNSITAEGAKAFLQALQLYQSPIKILFGANSEIPTPNTLADFEPYAPLLVNDNLHVRFMRCFIFNDATLLSEYDRGTKSIKSTPCSTNTDYKQLA